jgi:activator of HSP90 ATPase
LGQGEGVEENECYIPEEVIKKGSFIVSVFSGDLITTITETIQVEDSGYTEDIEIEDDPSQPNWLDEKINRQIEKYLLEGEFVIDAN